MKNKIERRFSAYLNKTLKGYAKKQKIKYQKELDRNKRLSDTDIIKASYKNYLLNNDSFEDIDVDINHLENIFHNEKYCIAMRNVPLRQRQVLYLLFIKEYTIDEVAKMFKTTSSNINKLKQNAIRNFKENLKKLEG